MLTIITPVVLNKLDERIGVNNSHLLMICCLVNIIIGHAGSVCA
jgi:hypothetical protein